MRSPYLVLTMACAMLALPGAAQNTSPAVSQPTVVPAKKPKKVWTNEDFASHPSAPSAPATSTPQPPPAASAEASTATPPNGVTTSTSVSTPATASANTRLQAIRAEKNDLQHKLERMQQDLAKADSEFRRQMFQDAIEHANSKIAQLSKEEAALEQQVQSTH